MIIMFTKSKKVGSRVIRWITGEDISHVALLLNAGVVVHAKFTGVDIDSLEHFLKENTVVRRYSYTGSDAINIEKRAMSLEGSSYDKLAFFGMGFYMLMMKYIGWSIPAFSHWAERGQFICTEFIDTIIGEKECNKHLSPMQLEQQILNSKQWFLRN
jgi:hypothetical protein